MISTVKDRAVFVAPPDIWYSRLFVPIKGILVVHDTRTGTFKPLPCADDAEFVQNKEPFKFDLYRVPFNDGRGGRAEPIEGPSRNGKSNYFAKFSPDGK